MVVPDTYLPVTLEEFKGLLPAFLLSEEFHTLGVAVSGGPDSMALTYLLSQWALEQNKEILAVTVDHGLRPESKREAQTVGAWIQNWPHVKHSVLEWEGPKPDSKVLEEARAARYDLLEKYYANNTVRIIFVAHHLDDQAETFLIRLSKGSGLDGLSGMRIVQPMSEAPENSIKLLRPFLSIPKERLIKTCEVSDIPYVNDPSNEKEDFLRPRLRAARDILELEGLTNKRLAVTASRIGRARDALEHYSHKAFSDHCNYNDDGSYSVPLSLLETVPEDISIRVILRVIDELNPASRYGPRLERVEALFDRLVKGVSKKETLAGCIFTKDTKRAILKIEKENT